MGLAFPRKTTTTLIRDAMGPCFAQVGLPCQKLLRANCYGTFRSLTS